MEEGLQGGWAEFVKQAARVVSDKTKGTSFGTKIDVGKIFQQTLEDYTASLVPMGIDMFASQGLSFAMRLPLDAKMVSNANGRFERSGDVANIDSIGTYGLIPTKKDVATVQEAEGSRQAATSNETGKRKPFDVYEDKYGGLHAVYQEDAQVIRDMKRDGVTGVRVNVVNREGSGSPLTNLADGDKQAFARFAEEAGSALGASGIGEDKQGRHVFVFQDKEGMEAAYAQLRGEAMDTDIGQDGTRAVVSFVQRAENGNTAYQELVLTTKEEEIAENKHVPTDTFEDDVADIELERPLSVAMLDQDSAVSAQEVRALRTKLRDNYGITGRKNKAAAQAYAVASGILHVPSLDLADRLRIVFEGDEAARAELRENGFSEERGANGWMTNEGGGGFTIHLTRTATPATLFHETGHIVRALASADQLADVERVYGIQGHQWSRNAEERFADDFVRYLRTRQAPTAKIRYLFDQIKNLLSYITGGKYAESLSDETAKAFERLWMGKADEGVLTGNNTQSSPLLETSGKNELKDSLEKAISESPESRRAFAEVLQAAPVYTSEKLVQWEKKGNGYIDSVVGFWNEKYGGTVEHNGRKVLLTKETYKDSLAHTKAANKFWFAAFAAVPEVIRNGSTILQQSDWKGRGYNTETIGAMIKLNADDETLALVVVDHYPNGVSRAYLHKIVAKENLRQLKTRLVTGTGDNSTIASDSNSVKGAEFELAEDTPSMAEVRRKYEGTDKWMKAPNGNQTNLTERQWLQVRTPEFKRWFGDWEADPEHASKVVDGNGEPLVVYHGTGERFEVFDRSLIGESTSNDGIWGKGFYFTPDMDIAQEYAEGTEGPDAHVEGTFLKMAEPYGMDQSVLDTPFSDAELAAAKDAREKADGDSGSPYSLLSYSMQDAQLVDMYRKISKGERFDGVVYRGEEDFRGFNRDEYVVPSSNQIKSATDNSGQFSAGSDSILFELADTSVRENQDGTLTVLHTLPASRIADIARIGGMPMPSLAITRPDLAPTDYGDVTLIGGGNLGRRLLSNGDIYDADMYSPTVPRPKYRLNKRKLAAADKRITSLMGRTSSFINSLSEYQYDTQEDLLALLSRDDRVQEAFLKEKGATYRLGKKKRTTLLDEKAVRTIRDWAEANDVEHIDSSNEEDFRKIYMREVERIIASNADMPVFLKRILRNEPPQDAFQEVMHAGETEDDETTRITKRNQRIAEVGGFRDWLESLIDGVYGDAYVEVPGAGNLPYTASNIIKAMEGSGRTDAAGLLAYGLGQAMSNAARPFSSREEMRGKEGLLSDARAERLDIVDTDAFFQMLEKTAREGGGNPMTARQEYFKAVGDYLKGGLESDASRMREVLSRHGFKADGAMIDATMGLVDDALQHPRKYFEAKPEQVMQFSDFQAAVVPDDISPSDEAVLRDAGLDIVHYDHGDANGQTDAVRNYTDEHQGQTLFELSEREKVNIARQVDSLTKQDIGKPHAIIDISSHTPFVFTELGFDDLKVVMYRDKLARGLYLPEDRKHGHEEGLDKGIVKDVLASFADPLYVFDSKTDDNSLVAVYDVLDKHGNPVMSSITIDKNSNRVLVNLVTSIYGKTRRKYQSWVDSGLLRYADDIRKNLPDSARLQLPSKPEGSYRDNIIYKSQLVNKPGAFFELAGDEEVSPKTLFELTDEQRDGFVKKWRTDVERAVRGYEVVPTRVLEQFRGEDWADEELALREAVMDDPELWRMAEEAEDPDQLRQMLKDSLEDEQGMEDNPLYDEEEVREHKRQRELLEQALASLSPDGRGATGDWVAMLYWYTRTRTQEERDQEFLRTYASGKEGVLKLKAAIGKGYQTPVLSKRVHSKTGDKTYYGMQNHWPAYKGISQKVLHLPADATDAQVQEAIDKIRENPRRYRQVLDFVESNNAYAQTVMEGMGRGDDGIMDSYQARTAAIESDEDLKKLEASGIPALAGFARRKRKRIDGLANHARHGIRTSKFEGINNRIQVAKRIGYGYRDDNCFFTTIRSISIPDPGSLSPKKM